MTGTTTSNNHSTFPYHHTTAPLVEMTKHCLDCGLTTKVYGGSPLFCGNCGKRLHLGGFT